MVWLALAWPGAWAQSTALAPAAETASAAGPPAAAPPGDAERIERVMLRIAADFDTRTLLRMGPALQQQVEALAAEHLQRVRERLAAWWVEERALPGPVSLEERARSWLGNEYALWRIDSLGPEDDALQRRLLAAPENCLRYSDPPGLRFVVAQIERLPVAERPKALALERDRLARWGLDRGALPAWPETMPEDQLAKLVNAALRTEEEVVPPLPTALIRAHARDADQSLMANLYLRCVAVAWWLQRTGDAPGTLAPARLALMPRARSAVVGVKAEPGGYPPLAALRGIEGRLAVAVDVDADGRPQQPRIVRRAVTVPGVRGRPVAFETLFDTATLVRVKSMRFDDLRGQKHLVEINWSLPR